MLFQFGSKNCFVVNRSKGTSEITPNTNKVARYLALFLVLKKPSTSKNAKKVKMQRLGMQFYR